MYWRIHKGIAGQKLEEILDWISQQGDYAQVVEGPKKTLPGPPSTETDIPGLALTTLHDIRDLPWGAIPGAYWNNKKFQVSYYLPRLDASLPLLNRNGLFLPVGCLHALTDYSEFVASGAFIRPDSGQKPFPGLAFSNGLLSYPSRFENALSGFVQTYKLAPELLCYCAPARELQAIEWRVWIVNRQVVAWSPYSWGDEQPAWQPAPPAVLEAAWAMALNSWQPDIAYVVDVAISHGQALIIELNAASTSGLYDAPIAPLFSALRDASHQEAAGLIESMAD